MRNLLNSLHHKFSTIVYRQFKNLKPRLGAAKFQIKALWKEDNMQTISQFHIPTENNIFKKTGCIMKKQRSVFSLFSSPKSQAHALLLGF